MLCYVMSYMCVTTSHQDNCSLKQQELLGELNKSKICFLFHRVFGHEYEFAISLHIKTMFKLIYGNKLQYIVPTGPTDGCADG